MRIPIGRSRRPLSRLLLLGILLAVPASAAALDPVNQSFFGTAIEGADPVAYFTEGRHLPGSKAFQAEWQGATWRFASARNRDLFVAEPARYAPQYGGYCAFAVAQGTTASIDPEAWTLVDGKLYLNYSKKIQQKWEARQDAFIEEADRRWPSLLSDD